VLFCRRSCVAVGRRYRQLSRRKRVALATLASLWLGGTILGILDAAFCTHGPLPAHGIVVGGDNSSSSTTRYAAAAEDSSQTFDVVINTYRRPRQLESAVRHYAQACGPSAGIGRVYVIWSEQGVDPPDDPLARYFSEGELSADNGNDNGNSIRRRTFSSNKIAPIRFIRTPNSLNSRFLPIHDDDPKEAKIATNAVFMVDDDVQVDCSSLRRGFDAWKSNPHSMVGYYPRLAAPPLFHTGQNAIRYIEHCWPIVFLRQRANFVLTKAAFLHARYMEVYWDDALHPREIRLYVDRHMNCEDVAMSLLVANYTRAFFGESTGGKGKSPIPPVFVEGRIRDAGLFNGISTGEGFVERRARCLSDLTGIYEQRGWGSPLDYSFALDDISWTRHVFRWPWQYRPANVFEWGALLDFFR